MKRITLAFVCLTLAFASCQSKYPDLDKGIYAEIVTNKGTFVAKLYHEATPLTTANFVSLAQGTNEMVDSAFAGKKYFNGLTFHRVMKGFMIQGGDPKGNGTGDPGYKFADEFVDSLKHDRKGILSMANGGPDGNGSQFFVTLAETPWLDPKHSIFGEIVLGQEVVDSIGSVPVAAGSNKPLDSVTMKEVNIINVGSIKVPSFTEEMEKIEKAKLEKAERVAKVAEASIKSLNSRLENAETLESGVKIFYEVKGNGGKPAIGSTALMNYAGYLTDGKLFDSNSREIEEKYGMLNPQKIAQNMYAPAPVPNYGPEARLVPGFREGLLALNIGDKAVISIPPHLAYGERGIPGLIPSNSDLIFEIELVGVQE